MIGDEMLWIPGFLPLHIQSQGTNGISVQHVIHSIIVQQAPCMPPQLRGGALVKAAAKIGDDKWHTTRDAQNWLWPATHESTHMHHAQP